MKAKIVNQFPYPVSLVWRNEGQDDEPLSIVVDDLPDVWTIATNAGHRFEVVKRGTDEVVDYFLIDKGFEVVVNVGPFERSPSDGIRATLVNSFPFPVSLYWIKYEDDGQERELMVESLSDVYDFQSTIGHAFVVVKLDSGEDVDSFEITGGESNRDFVFSVGSSVSKIPNKGHTDDDSEIDGLSEGNDEL